MDSLIQLIDAAFVTHAFYARMKHLTAAETYIILLLYWRSPLIVSMCYYIYIYMRII